MRGFVHWLCIHFWCSNFFFSSHLVLPSPSHSITAEANQPHSFPSAHLPTFCRGHRGRECVCIHSPFLPFLSGHPQTRRSSPRSLRRNPLRSRKEIESMNTRRRGRGRLKPRSIRKGKRRLARLCTKNRRLLHLREIHAMYRLHGFCGFGEKNVCDIHSFILLAERNREGILSLLRLLCRSLHSLPLSSA